VKHSGRDARVTARGVPFMSARLKPRLVLAVFRRYLRRCVVIDPTDATSPTDPRTLRDLRPARRIGFPHHH
jgi:hypothetical protein